MELALSFDLDIDGNDDDDDEVRRPVSPNDAESVGTSRDASSDGQHGGDSDSAVGASDGMQTSSSLDSMILNFRARARKAGDVTARNAAANQESPQSAAPSSVLPLSSSSRSPPPVSRLHSQSPVSSRHGTVPPPLRSFVSAPSKLSVSTSRPLRTGGSAQLAGRHKLSTNLATHTTRLRAPPQLSSSSSPVSVKKPIRQRQQQSPQQQKQQQQQHRASDESDRDEDAAVRPLPKLTQLPRPKPSLVLIPRSQLLEIPKPKPKSNLTTALSARAASSDQTQSHQQSQKQQQRPALTAIKHTLTTPPSQSPTLSSPRDGRPPHFESLLSPLLPSSSLSIASEGSEPSEATGLGDESIDHLIGDDIDQLRHLIASARHGAARATSADSARSTPATTVAASTAAAPTAAAQSALPFSHLVVLSRRHRQRVRGTEQSRSLSPPPPPPPLDSDDNSDGNVMEDSFTEELRQLRATARTLRADRDADADVVTPVAAGGGDGNKKPTAQHSAGVAAAAGWEPTIASADTDAATTIREVSNAIDEALLLALQPLERRRKELDRQDAADAAVAGADAASSAPLGITNTLLVQSAASPLPIAAQAIVEHLDLAFGPMTEQRNAELSAVTAAEAAAKAAVDAATKQAEDKQQADARAAKQREEEILSLLPLRGRLLATVTDVDDALRRLEHAETHASDIVRAVAGRSVVGGTPPPPETDGSDGIRDTGRVDQHQSPLPTRIPAATTTSFAIEDELVQLQQRTRRRMQDLEQRHVRSHSHEAQQRVDGRVDWQRAAFERNDTVWLGDERDSIDIDGRGYQATTAIAIHTAATAAAFDDTTTSSADGSFRDIVQQHVVQKLDLTVLQLRHALGVDAKEAAEVAETRAREHAARQQQQCEAADARARKQQAQAHAAAARRRVMGLTSLAQLRSDADSAAASGDVGGGGRVRAIERNRNSESGESGESSGGSVESDDDAAMQRRRLFALWLHRPHTQASAREIDHVLEALDARIDSGGGSMRHTVRRVAASAPNCLDTRRALSRFEALAALMAGDTASGSCSELHDEQSASGKAQALGRRRHEHQQQQNQQQQRRSSRSRLLEPRRLHDPPTEPHQPHGRQRLGRYSSAAPRAMDSDISSDGGRHADLDLDLDRDHSSDDDGIGDGDAHHRHHDDGVDDASAPHARHRYVCFASSSSSDDNDGDNNADARAFDLLVAGARSFEPLKAKARPHTGDLKYQHVRPQYQRDKRTRHADRVGAERDEQSRQRVWPLTESAIAKTAAAAMRGHRVIAAPDVQIHNGYKQRTQHKQRTEHTLRHTSNNSSSNPSTAIARAQQQIARLQADRREKRAWVASRLQHARE